MQPNRNVLFELYAKFKLIFTRKKVFDRAKKKPKSYEKLQNISTIDYFQTMFEYGAGKKRGNFVTNPSYHLTRKFG